MCAFLNWSEVKFFLKLSGITYSVFSKRMMIAHSLSFPHLGLVVLVVL